MPETITTDGLGSYGAAIGVVFPHTKHIVAHVIHAAVNNNQSERGQGTFRDRTKTLSGLQGQASGQKYLDGFVTDYNHFRDHHAHGGETPGAIAKARPGLDDWADVVEIVSRLKAAGLDQRTKKPAGRKMVAARVGDISKPVPVKKAGRGKLW